LVVRQEHRVIGSQCLLNQGTLINSGSELVVATSSPGLMFERDREVVDVVSSLERGIRSPR